MKVFFLVACFALFTFNALAGETPKQHLTGNPQVDFFSTRGLRIPTVVRDSTPSFSMESTKPSKKSPWLAGALSLAIPGLGEYYDGSYVKSAIFFGIEVASWVSVYIYNKKGDDQTAMFEEYANQHWSPVRYALWTYDNAEALNNQVNRDNYDLFYGANMDSIRDQQYSLRPPFSEVYWDEVRSFERDIADGVTNGYTHQLPYYGQQQYYELIGKYVQFYAGWDDATDVNSPYFMDKIPSQFTPSEASRYRIYANMRAQANNYYDIASTMVSVAILNHIVSAIDAAWTAGRMNAAIDAHVGVRLQPTPFGMVPIREANISLTF